MTHDPWQETEVRKWAHRFEREVLPKIKNSTIGISIAPTDGDFDVKFAVELGAMIMLDKPILVIAAVGQVIPPKLMAIAHRVVYADMTTEAGQEAVMAAIQEMPT